MKQAKYIEVYAGVRYWEDALLNGKQDEEGNIPLRNDRYWAPTIELATGRILDWPEGTEADIHYKVCDDGKYWLLDESRNRIAEWKGSYVPNSILCVGDDGYGDYIILTVEGDGKILAWEPPALDEKRWNPIP